MPYWRLYYHLAWTTDQRQPVLDEGLASVVERSIRTTCRDRGAILHAVSVMPDDVHVVVSIPPSIAISTFVGRLKGAASHAVNAIGSTTSGVSFAWQGEYGALSFGERAVPDVVAYVNDQHLRHADQRLSSAMEQPTDRAQPGSPGLSGSAWGL